MMAATGITTSEKPPRLGPYKPTVILHGGAGVITRDSLPPELWSKYHASLLNYLTSARKLLDSGGSALDAACYAVTQFEDDPLFNCGRGSVFTEQGTIEMEASVMVSSIEPAGPPVGAIKRAAAVSLIRNTRHPILLAKEVLTAADDDGGFGGISSMHSHLSGSQVEEWGWNEKGLEKKPDRWFWTKKRWEEHRRGLQKSNAYTFEDLLASQGPDSDSSPLSPDEELLERIGVSNIPSQGTVGAVCLDSWGNLAVATSTGGLTNKKAGRIGDTPTIGAGFWAESWTDDVPLSAEGRRYDAIRMRPHSLALDHLWRLGSWFAPCLNGSGSDVEDSRWNDAPPAYTAIPTPTPTRATPSQAYYSPLCPIMPVPSGDQTLRRAVAMSGTGNGDSFLRTDAVRTAAAMARFSASTSLADAVTAVAGPGGLLQSSAGNRWGRTAEGLGGIIGVELIESADTANPGILYGHTKGSGHKSGRAVFDFNCGGLFRAYYEIDEEGQKEKPVAMVFRDEY
ncbi:hypothetical protein HRR83_009435 [Exophiala dermatitidis]|uniref:L-asparaginase n=1 Tax=Exophiala dermatitidis TaxID=5970 RepID=A0AAN6EJK8_EXODE|nr:hypothetical protein HRR73_009522 [Exophiala dermatitidis]KAJ4502761.1 hypothetical protein HRR74_009518 [Exophiala dermatitidis]KAJ4530348.1 hypothetical protein HRR77_009499 [Exophiala dermatitidis]KAJ4534265.1 hypothetical protein HRR76_006195 [Exophiala dermatitidis]KAJ4553264.1 hypothetical protein HRR79_009721 [Exophiala dermatitidis]